MKILTRLFFPKDGLFWQWSQSNILCSIVEWQEVLLGRTDPGGGASPTEGAPTYDFSEKLHEIEKSLARRGWGAPPLDPPLKSVRIHTKWRVLTFDWSVNSYIMVVCENFLKFNQNFFMSTVWLKTFLNDNKKHHKTINGPVRSESFSCRVLVVYTGNLLQYNPICISNFEEDVMVWLTVKLLPSANEVYVFTPVCQSFCSQGGVCLSACWDTTPGSRHPTAKQTPPGTRPPRSRHPPRSRPPPPQEPESRDGYCCGRYASYWNAFLFHQYFTLTGQIRTEIIVRQKRSE